MARRPEFDEKVALSAEACYAIDDGALVSGAGVEKAPRARFGSSGRRLMEESAELAP